MSSPSNTSAIALLIPYHLLNYEHTRHPHTRESIHNLPVDDQQGLQLALREPNHDI
ncbi:hypothetical protein [Acinetobacter pittii]|uniref:hypothetical protein n=1 Tax=Acinetobacter pittii TaxID=48296 RepID=UPI001934235C|nr:hypothetical protein [Acinetobacter pittii]QRF07637.1 hypothetical protein HRJ47_06435 [Acinetobacter pittii]